MCFNRTFYNYFYMRWNVSNIENFYNYFYMKEFYWITNFIYFSTQVNMLSIKYKKFLERH